LGVNLVTVFDKRVWYVKKVKNHSPSLITVIGIWVWTRFGFRICIDFWNIIYGLHLDLENINTFISGKNSKQKYEGDCQVPAHTTTMCLMHCTLRAPQYKAKSQRCLRVRWNTWPLKCHNTRTSLRDTVKTENLHQYWSKLKHKKLTSLCTNEVCFSIRCLEMLKTWRWLKSLVVDYMPRVESSHRKPWLQSSRDESLTRITLSMRTRSANLIIE